jgi:hypothetical protein
MYHVSMAMATVWAIMVPNGTNLSMIEIIPWNIIYWEILVATRVRTAWKSSSPLSITTSVSFVGRDEARLKGST